ncbi:uncharacterized protein DMAD_04324 [Drosophila madeirensis]|uniref:Uncharacterized protein n=1 Tax=Drosophila madeirensis TaxID=30013 RepID=A0AAU9GD75_DROMD
MWPINLYAVLCVFCLLFGMNHRRHGDTLAAPIQLNEQGARGSNKSSFQEPAQETKLDLKIDETLMAPTQINELVSGLTIGVPVASNIMKNPPMVMVNKKSGSEQIEADGKPRRGRAVFSQNGTGATKTWPKELTIPLARGMVGILGRAKQVKVVNPWTVTYGDVWRDTRLAAQWMSRVPRIHLASSPVVDYYPDDKKLVSVCYPHKKKSSIALYNIYGVTMVPWFKRHIYKKAFRYRKLTPLRDAEHQIMEYQCHNRTTLKTTVLEHLSCTSRAFAMMTRRLGYYPRHQNWWVYPAVE